MIRRYITLVAILGAILGTTALAAAPARAGDVEDFDARIAGVVTRLDTEVGADRGLSAVLAGMLHDDYGTSQTEILWALERDISWGRIGLLAYSQATTGWSFDELAAAGAHTNAADFAAEREMSQDKMVGSLEELARKAMRERNTRIFDRLRSVRRVEALPDLGSGFGLFQEALDFRRIGPPTPTKIHSGPGFAAKGGKEKQ